MNIVFFGSGAYGLPTLANLAETHSLRAIVSQPDRKAGRGGKLAPTPISQWALANAPDTPLVRETNVNEQAVRDAIRAHDIDAWVIIAFGQKLSPELLADRFAINLHASLLPRWRGAAPINHAILAGDAETGNSVITLADRMDAGLVLGQSRRPIEPHLTAGELHDLLSEDGPDVVETILSAHNAGTLVGSEQDESLVTSAGKLAKSDGILRFDVPADELRCRVHGLTPWPGAAATFRGESLKVLRVETADQSPEQQEPGTLIDAGSGVVACAAGSAVRLIEIQRPGKRAMSWTDFARGTDPTNGEQMEPGSK